jgi:caffeoyl-CoA O-methyltransferase
MSSKATPMTPELQRYAVEHSPQDDLLRRLGERTAGLGDISRMQMAPEQGAMTTVIVRAIGARRALEIGTFTGYGSICIARGLPGDGKLLTCDLSDEWTAIAREHWAADPAVESRIELRLGPAIETLEGLDGSDPFDFVFIDADKESYPAYYEEAMRLLRPGGLVMVDNVFRGGDVVDPDVDDEGVRGIRELNDRIAADPRVGSSAMVGVADGVTLALKL